MGSSGFAFVLPFSLNFVTAPLHIAPSTAMHCVVAQLSDKTQSNTSAFSLKSEKALVHKV